LAAEKFYESAGELEAAWQDKERGKGLGEIRSDFGTCGEIVREGNAMKMPTLDRDNQATRFYFGFVLFGFPYETAIAFQFEGRPMVVAENMWSRTTGKHLNAIDPTNNNRVDYQTFQRLWTDGQLKGWG
jgi:hypothetical protein